MANSFKEINKKRAVVREETKDVESESDTENFQDQGRNNSLGSDSNFKSIQNKISELENKLNGMMNVSSKSNPFLGSG